MEIDNRMVKRKGLSPVIASVLMIALVLVLAAMIFLWARGFIGEQIEKFGRPIDEICGNVDFRIERVGDNLEVANRGDIDIRHLDIKLIKDGNSEMAKFDIQIDAGKAETQAVDLLMEDGSKPEEIIVYPALIGGVRGESSIRAFTCLDAGKTL